MNNRNHVPHPWSDDLEAALIEQSKIILGERRGAASNPRTAILVLIAAAAIAGLVLLCFANWS